MMPVEIKKTRLSKVSLPTDECWSVTSCLVPSERLHELMPTLSPLLQREPIAITGPDGTRYVLIDQAQFEAWRMGSDRASASHSLSDTVDLTVSDVADRLMEQEYRRVRSGDFAEASWHIMRNRLDRHILPAMGLLSIAQVDRQAIEGLMTRLLDEQASATTQSQYLVIVRKLLKLAHQEHWIDAIPDLPRVRVSHKPRSALTLPQYRRILRVAKALSAQGREAPVFKTGEGQRERFWVTPRYRSLPPDFYALVIFMVNSFVRPSDIKNLRHQHIETVRGAHTYLRLNLPESKRHDKPIVSLQPAVRVYEWLCQQRTGGVQEGDWVFLPQEKDREHALGLFNFWLKWVLREAGLGLTDAHGQARTLYCLRHTAITFRLLYGEGIDMLTLARNARTSVDMIEKFYASTLTGEMNVGLLQSRRAQKKAPGRAQG
jgi:integrase